MTIERQNNLSFWQICNLTVGFFGVQFGWALQMANTSAIYEYLGANVEQLPLLWLAAPVSGLIVQPIIGYFSDRTWTPLGRRRPYFLVGAMLSSIALVLMPNSSSLWMAAGLLWILDSSINISTEPFRAFLADSLNVEQRTQGYAMQSFFVGLGAVVASIFPWFLNNVVGLDNSTTNGNTVPLTVKLSFYVGAVFFFSAILWTVFTTKEQPPQNFNTVRLTKFCVETSRGSRGAGEEENKPYWDSIAQNLAHQSTNKPQQSIITLLKKMPKTMKQLAWVQFFTWIGMFCVFLYFPPAVAHNIFGAVSENSQLYTNGIEWAGICIGFYSGVCLLFSWWLPQLAAIITRKATHAFCLLCGGLGIISLLFIRDPYLMLLPMTGFGIAWASILAMPYTILSYSLPPQNMGFYMGIFNVFIVIPQIVAALGLGLVMVHFLDGDRLLAVVLGGFSLLVAAFCVGGVEDVAEEREISLQAIVTQLFANN